MHSELRDYRRNFRDLARFNPALKLHANYPLSGVSTFRIGGEAGLMAKPLNVGELIKVLTFAQKSSLPTYILGGGSNVLFDDLGFQGVMIKPTGDFRNIEEKENLILAGSMCHLNELAHLTADRGYDGFCNLVGIPGTVGGAIVMNAGASGSSMADRVEEVTLINRSFKMKTFKRRELRFGYRSFTAPETGIIISALLNVGENVGKNVASVKMKERYDERRRLIPKGPSAGSVFKNPPGKYAGSLIEKCRLKGRQVGEAMISPRHANIIINKGKASAAEVTTLIHMARFEVYKKFHIELALEIKVLNRRGGTYL
ncbi:MAG: UDP-N-acetylmuramate dehydrogenase [Deltaproteobacteria bacterium]|jgi:UDP-N-acetylmuramate dehydrogenase|nr:UDP-N-acetylmuramate dehydrogenase [Deltaproteobacteria bacterium]